MLVREGKVPKFVLGMTVNRSRPTNQKNVVDWMPMAEICKISHVLSKRMWQVGCIWLRSAKSRVAHVPNECDRLDTEIHRSVKTHLKNRR